MAFDPVAATAKTASLKVRLEEVEKEARHYLCLAEAKFGEMHELHKEVQAILRAGEASLLHSKAHEHHHSTALQAYHMGVYRPLQTCELDHGPELSTGSMGLLQSFKKLPAIIPASQKPTRILPRRPLWTATPPETSSKKLNDAVKLTGTTHSS